MKFGGPDKGKKIKEEMEFFKLNKYLLNSVDYKELSKKKQLKYTRMEAIYSKKTLKTVAYLY